MATGGAQKVLLDQAYWFHERGHNVTVAFLYDKERFHRRWQDTFAFPIVDLKGFQKNRSALLNGWSILKALWLLWRLLRRKKFDVIETFTHDSNMFALPLAWLARVPVRIASHHGMIEGFSGWREKIHAWMINHDLAQRIVCVSEMTRQIAIKEGVQAERVLVIQNGIRPVPIEGVDRPRVRKEAGIQEQDVFLLSVGRLVYSKAHEYLIAAMPEVLRQFPNVKVGICGDGVLRADLEAQIQSLGLSSSVKLLGMSDRVASYLASADVFVMPSRSEGLPIALLEAMSAGLPIIVTKVEGVNEVIVDGEQGLLVPIGDVDALARAILQLLHDPAMRARMGHSSKQRMAEFYSIDHMGERYLALMVELLEARA
jgi:glycosyltransferase involved in cell wall biosynthesis